jgi:hypothetical protein
MTGYIKKRSDTDYVIGCNSQGQGGYNVVPKELDPYNAYTIEEVEAYLTEHPEMLLGYEQIEAEKTILSELATLKAYLSDTDYIYPKCLELDLDVTYVYSDVVQKRKEARQRIQTLEQGL